MGLPAAVQQSTGLLPGEPAFPRGRGLYGVLNRGDSGDPAAGVRPDQGGPQDANLAQDRARLRAAVAGVPLDDGRC
jgi:hypothetical protein